MLLGWCDEPKLKYVQDFPWNPRYKNHFVYTDVTDSWALFDKISIGNELARITETLLWSDYFYPNEAHTGQMKSSYNVTPDLFGIQMVTLPNQNLRYL